MLSQEDRELAIRDAAWEDGKAEGMAEGEAKGEAKAFERVAKLKGALEKDGRLGEFADAFGDARKLEALMHEFGIA